ncbi:MAG TPA: molybdenum cofactor biosynthesis protein MoaE [Planctomycetota bacterium]|nr:molybdenum cofactor biosynthesis protein MoaE [Planctomycetota bacterium]
MRITVRCFAAAREALGHDVLDLDVPPGSTVASVKALLIERAPAFARVPAVCAVNRSYATGERTLQDGDEVAFIPPISGGGGSELFRFTFSREPLDPRALEREVRTDADGAIVTFHGVTRNRHEGREVVSLSYEAYEEMAMKVMVEVFEAALRQFRIGRARVAHRLGEVPVGETSVVIVVAAEHRADAFDACRFLIDRLKTSVPIFKREQYRDASEPPRWLGDLPAGQTPV